MSNHADYRKHNDRSQNSSTYHKKDGTNTRAILKREAAEEIGGITRIRCISLWEPWASAIAEGLKTVETRGRPAPSTVIGQRIGIQAAMTDKGLKLLEQHSHEA